MTPQKKEPICSIQGTFGEISNIITFALKNRSLMNPEVENYATLAQTGLNCPFAKKWGFLSGNDKHAIFVHLHS